LPATSLIAIGASAGGVESLQAFMRYLPADLDAAVVVVLHLPPGARSLLAGILGRAGGLPASDVHDGEEIEPGRIYVAPPDRHVLVEDQSFRLASGPTENAARPAIDPLFRSVAAAYGDRAIGVVLSGSLDDGTAGLADIKRHGGVAMVEDPATASHPSMPRSAIDHVDVDVVGDCQTLALRAAAVVTDWQSKNGAEDRQTS
jgi:two-component system chemotaxis response regulator CheB